MGLDLPCAQVICEVRCSAIRGAVVRDCLEPANGALDEVERRHGDALISSGDRIEHVDQPHVVIRGQPQDGSRIDSLLDSLVDQPQVGKDVGVADHDSTRSSCRARGVLDECEIVRLWVVRHPILCFGAGLLIRCDPPRSLQLGNELDDCVGEPLEGACDENARRFGFRRDGT